MAADASDAGAWQRAWSAWLGTPGAGEASVDGLAQAWRRFGEQLAALAQGGDAARTARALAEQLERYARGGDASGLEDLFGAVPLALAAAQKPFGESALERKLRETLFGWAEEILRLPPIGPLRDWQAALLAWQRAQLAEQRAGAIVQTHYRRAHGEALARYARWIREEDGPPVTTLRALYDAWVDQAEAAYADVVRGADFSRDFAAWINAGSAARREARGLRERIAQALDLPQRAEIDALLERNRALALELAELGRRVAALDERVALAAGVTPAMRSDARAGAAPLPASSPPGSADPGSASPVQAQVAPRAARARPAPSRRPARVRKQAAVKRPTAVPAGRGRFDIGDILSEGE